ncbi:DUF6912 family protein [Ornithinimicrobium cavernae]|uniref:DUF6912 family protein n=1 Tax=Ornithinimicrobium cavernae TaxID=2666047 RepID=UPI000D69A3D9|nr:hypothetical protein [Ornithinimicrobium cavernae]
MAVIPQQIRCYLPLTAGQVEELHEQGSMQGDLVAFVVTESVRGSDPTGDEESWEYAALQDAAAHCHEAGLPVVVAAADVGRDTIEDSASTGSRVTVHGPVSLPRIASLHVGDDLLGEVPTVSADAGLIELSWYDATELAHVRSLL